MRKAYNERMSGKDYDCFKMRVYQMDSVEVLANRRDVAEQEYIRASEKLDKQKKKIAKSLNPLEDRKKQFRKMLPEVCVTIGNGPGW